MIAHIAQLLALAGSAATQEHPPASGAPSRDLLETGRWVEVRGEYEAGVFRADKVELLPPAEFEMLVGRVTDDIELGRRFLLLGQQVHSSERTEWKGQPRALAGQLVKVEGRYRGPRKLSAREISTRKGGRARLAGRIDAVEPYAGGHELRVMHYRVLVPADSTLELGAPLHALTRIPPRFAPPSRDTDLPDEDDLFGEGFDLGAGFVFTGQIEAKYESEDEFDLNAADDEDRVDTLGGLRGRLTWQPGGQWSGVATFRETLRYRDDDEDGNESSSDFRVAETYLSWHPERSTLAVSLGRHDFDDPREWIYDENLDGVRLDWRGSNVAADLSLTTKLSDGSPADEEALNAMAYVSNLDSERHLAGYVVHRDFGSFSTDHSTHFGARALGEWLRDDVDGWLELALLGGDRAGARVEAWGIDVGSTWEPDFAPRFAFTAGWALGSGDGQVGGTDRGFRQTGLQDNNGNFAGVTSFRYYGELVEPELANLGVVTLGLGYRIADRTSLDVVWHSYYQDHAAPVLGETNLDQRPTGLDPEIGNELDVILGSREWKNWDLELVGGWFSPGAAFDTEEDAYVAKIQIRYRF